ncbi:MAG TPA: methyltransferase domain-containing protein [Candidatus Acidoferrales bacterium]|nr:methyltransferase domain-containing protein [Candidatus Acidoferrales bacterium]
MQWPFGRRKLSPIEQLEKSFADFRTAAFFVPTPWAIARQMLEFAEVTPDDVLYDLGSGDGRIPILAAQEFGCRAVGVEMDEALCRYSSQSAAKLNLQDRVTFQEADFFNVDFSAATVVTTYLLSAVNGYLRPRLASHLRAGARVVALDFDVPGWKPERTLAAKSDADVEYTLFLYRRCSPAESLEKLVRNASQAQAARRTQNMQLVANRG